MRDFCRQLERELNTAKLALSDEQTERQMQASACDDAEKVIANCESEIARLRAELAAATAKISEYSKWVRPEWELKPAATCKHIYITLSATSRGLRQCANCGTVLFGGEKS